MNNFASTSSRNALSAVFATTLAGVLSMACSSSSTTTNPPGTNSNDDAGTAATDDGGAPILTLGAKQCTAFAGKTTAIAGASSGAGPSLAVDGTVYEATLPSVSTTATENGTDHLYDGNFHVSIPGPGTLYFFSDSTRPFSSASVSVGVNSGVGPGGNLFCHATDWLDASGNGPMASPCTFGCNAVQFAEAFQIVNAGTYDVDVNSGNLDGPINPAVNSASIKMSFTFVPSN
jgi:hypothetical protein